MRHHADGDPRGGTVTGIRVAVDATPLIGEPSGVGEFCAGALAALPGVAGIDVRAFAVTWRMRGEMEAQLPPGVAAVRRPMPARPLHLLWARSDLPPIEAFTGPVEVVHGTNFVVPPALRAARVVTVHDLTPLKFPELCHPSTLAFPGLVRRAIAKGAFVHVPSAYVAGEVCEAFGVDLDRVRVVHHGVPAEPADPAEPAEPAEPQSYLPAGRYILALGTVEPRKDLPSLVAAFDRLAAEVPDLWLVIAGRDGWGAPELDAALAAARNAGRVIRLGYVSRRDRAALLSSAAVFAYPSLYEGFGLPPLEAMASSVPVVATRAGALPEVLGDAAVMVEPRDVDALAAAMSLLLGDSDARRLAVSRGVSRVARYSWKACAEGLAQLYRDAWDAR
ncbi:MAG: glycosyltransferase family 4 protein [Acidimicrobiales bacterium]